MSTSRIDESAAVMVNVLGRSTKTTCAQRVLWTAISILAITAGGCGGCGSGGSDANDRHAKWGGVTKEQWMKQRQEKARQEEREAEEARNKEKQAKEEDRKRREEKARQEAEEQASSLAAGRAKPQPETQDATATPKQPMSEAPVLPEAFSEWREADFLTARLLGDPRLAPAIEITKPIRAAHQTLTSELKIVVEKDRGTAVVPNERERRCCFTVF
ncbi:MAG: hypothetical protein HUU20_26955 [Pirellulales bacterium]|nr:hypothetical protein [Pirellulales bacterium]